MRRRWIIALLAATSLLATACGTEDATAPTDGTPETGELELDQQGVLVAGSDLDFAPFEFVEDGEVKGFDIDLLDEIGERLGLDVEYVNASFDTIFTQLAAGEFDAIISAITITEERRQTIEFTDPYFAANQALVVAADSDIRGVEDLVGVDVGAQAATTGLDYARENFSEARVVEFPQYPAAFAALEAGQLDAVIADLPVAADQDARSDTIMVVTEIDTDELYGIGVRQESERLRAAINEVLGEIIADGTYEEIYGRWFEGDVPQQFRR